jgi:hypothetical protein
MDDFHLSFVQTKMAEFIVNVSIVSIKVKLGWSLTTNTSV